MNFTIEVSRAETWQVQLVGPHGTVHTHCDDWEPWRRALVSIWDQFSTAQREVLLPDLVETMTKAELAAARRRLGEPLQEAVEKHLDEPEWKGLTPVERVQAAGERLSEQATDRSDYAGLCEALGLPTNLTLDQALEELSERDVPTLLSWEQLREKFQERCPSVTLQVRHPSVTAEQSRAQEQLVAFVNGQRAEAARQAQARAAQDAKPIDMIIHCPACGVQHIDAPEPESDWHNPPHRSHECHGCGRIWRVADVPTNGVRTLSTAGKSDNWKGSAETPKPDKPEGARAPEKVDDKNALRVPCMSDSRDVLEFVRHDGFVEVNAADRAGDSVHVHLSPMQENRLRRWLNGNAPKDMPCTQKTPEGRWIAYWPAGVVANEWQPYDQPGSSAYVPLRFDRMDRVDLPNGGCVLVSKELDPHGKSPEAGRAAADRAPWPPACDMCGAVLTEPGAVELYDGDALVLGIAPPNRAGAVFVHRGVGQRTLASPHVTLHKKHICVDCFHRGAADPVDPADPVSPVDDSAQDELRKGAPDESDDSAEAIETPGADEPDDLRKGYEAAKGSNECGDSAEAIARYALDARSSGGLRDYWVKRIAARVSHLESCVDRRGRIEELQKQADVLQRSMVNDGSVYSDGLDYAAAVLRTRAREIEKKAEE